MKNSIFKFIGLVALALVPAGCAPSRPVDVGPQVATADNLYGNVGQPTQPPPDDQKDVVPPSPGLPAQWWFIPGNWVWRGQWVWVAGHWRTRPHSGDVWLKGKWDKQGDVYVWQKGHWRSGAHFGEESNGSD
jgi:hypothetical protein